MNRARPTFPFPPALAGAAALVLGAGLVGAALPAAIAGLIEAAGNPASRQMGGERPPGGPALEDLVRSREAAADWRAAGRLHAEIALARLMLAGTGDPATRDGQLALAEAALTRSLSLSPMSPYGWMRLVQVRTLRGSPDDDIARPLRLALRTGPHEERRDAMLMQTLEAGLRVWEQLDGRDRRLIAAKAREAWRRDALAAADAAGRTGRTALLASLLGL